MENQIKSNPINRKMTYISVILVYVYVYCQLSHIMTDRKAKTRQTGPKQGSSTAPLPSLRGIACYIMSPCMHKSTRSRKSLSLLVDSGILSTGLEVIPVGSSDW